jgi:hypothetical protein
MVDALISRLPEEIENEVNEWFKLFQHRRKWDIIQPQLSNTLSERLNFQTVKVFWTIYDHVTTEGMKKMYIITCETGELVIAIIQCEQDQDSDEEYVDLLGLLNGTQEYDEDVCNIEVITVTNFFGEFICTENISLQEVANKMKPFGLSIEEIKTIFLTVPLQKVVRPVPSKERVMTVIHTFHPTVAVVFRHPATFRGEAVLN